jgi:hypothetical protein
MHPPRTRKTTRAEAKHGVRGATDTDQLVGNAITARAYNDATPFIYNDADHQCPEEISSASRSTDMSTRSSLARVQRLQGFSDQAMRTAVTQPINSRHHRAD